MNKSLLKLCAVVLAFGSITSNCLESAPVMTAPADDNSIEVDSLDASTLQKRLWLFALTTGVLMYAGYNLHDFVHAEHIQETDEQCKRSGFDTVSKYTLDLTPKKMVRVGYMATFAAAAGYLWYIYGKSIVNYYAEQAKLEQKKI